MSKVIQAKHIKTSTPEKVQNRLPCPKIRVNRKIRGLIKRRVSEFVERKVLDNLGYVRYVRL
jgi:hypothetical protein